MTGHRVAGTIAMLLLAAAWAAVPATAAGSPLLSGYGGPGEGEQAILGSALLGSPNRGGGGGGPGSASLAAGNPSSAQQASNALAAPVARGNAARSRSGARARGPRHPLGASTVPGTSVVRAKNRPGAATGLAPAAIRGASLTSADSSQPLGLSGLDLVYMLLALGALVLTGVLTVKLTRRPS
jgi:hypothetical protein